MALIALATCGHSPGLTTAATALALRWPRPALLIEADTSKTSSLLPGYLRGQYPHTVGLDGLAIMSQRGELHPQNLWHEAIEIGERKHLVPAFARLGAGLGAGRFWGDLGTVLRSVDSAGVDAILDLGRLAVRDPRLALLEAADVTLIGAGAALPDIAALTARIDEQSTQLSSVHSRLDALGRREHARLLIIDRAKGNYSASEISPLAGMPAAGHLPWDPDSAAVWSMGEKRTRKLDRAAYQRSIDALGSELRKHITERRAVLSPLQHRPEGIDR